RNNTRRHYYRSAQRRVKKRDGRSENGEASWIPPRPRHCRVPPLLVRLVRSGGLITTLLVRREDCLEWKIEHYPRRRGGSRSKDAGWSCVSEESNGGSGPGRAV